MFNMNTNEIEVLKLGSIMTTKQANGLRRLNIVCDGGPVFDFYKSLVIEHTSKLFEFYETQKMFIGGPFPFNNPKRLIGKLDCKPISGQSLKMSSWSSSRITEVINDFIIITRNSVYVLHDISLLRDQRLTELGI